MQYWRFIPSSIMILNIFILVIFFCCLSDNLAFAITEEESDLHNARLLPSTPLFYIDDMSYYVEYHKKVTFIEAMQNCEMMNMRLATVKSERENTKLYEYMKSWNIDYQNFWVSGSNMVDGKTWHWMTTGEHIEYFNWNAGAGQPNRNRYCLDLYYIKNKGLIWYDVECERRYSYICERPKNLYYPGPLDKRDRYFTCINDTPCCGAYDGDLPLIEVKGMAYYVETSQKLSKYEAETFCNLHHMQLVTINNEKENSILRDVLLLYAKKDNNFWTSAERVNKNSLWLWRDEKPIEYFNWGHGEPDNANSKENCIAIFVKDNAYWSDKSCAKKFNFICQKY